MTGARTDRLLRALKTEIGGRVPLEFLAHHTMGLGLESYRAALKVGVDTLTTACEPLANGEAVPSTMDVLAMADEIGIPTNVDRDVVRRLDDHFQWIAYREGHEVATPTVFDPLKYQAFAGHQIPGGMMSNFRNQLRELGMLHRLDEVLEEASRVRAELGYPVMVTPFSQFVGVQATYNVILGERYKTIPQELTLYARGHYGKPAAAIDPNVMDRIFKGKSFEPIDSKAVFGAKILDEFRREKGPFVSDGQMLLHLFYGREATESMRRNRSRFPTAPTVGQPLQVLVQELARLQHVSTMKLEKGPMRIHVTYA
jgi:pyruvate/oxaloacetate carboxyltransferase